MITDAVRTARLIQGKWHGSDSRVMEISNEEAFFPASDLAYDIERVENDLVLETPDGRWRLLIDPFSEDTLWCKALSVKSTDMKFTRAETEENDPVSVTL